MRSAYAGPPTSTNLFASSVSVSGVKSFFFFWYLPSARFCRFRLFLPLLEVALELVERRWAKASTVPEDIPPLLVGDTPPAPKALLAVFENRLPVGEIFDDAAVEPTLKLAETELFWEFAELVDRQFPELSVFRQLDAVEELFTETPVFEEFVFGPLDRQLPALLLLFVVFNALFDAFAVLALFAVTPDELLLELRQEPLLLLCVV